MADLVSQELRLIGTVPLIFALVLLGYAIARPHVGRALLSASFDRFVTPPLLGVVYAVGLVVGVLAALYAFVRAVSWGIGIGTAVEMLIVGAATLVLYGVGLRVLVEVLVAVVRTAEATAAMSVHGVPGALTAMAAGVSEFCTECGASRLDGTRFCLQCGQAFV